MFSPNIYLFLIVLGYVLTLTFAGFYLYYKKNDIEPKHPLLFILLSGLLLRFIPAYFFPFSSRYELSSLFPSSLLLVSYFTYLSKVTEFPLLILLKFLPVLCDSLIAAVIYRITSSSKYALLYAVSPIGIISSALIGQFTSVPILFLLLSLHFMSNRKKSLSLISLAYAATFNPWTLIFLPLIILIEFNLRYLKKINIYNLVKYLLLITYIFSFSLNTLSLLWIFPIALITKDSFLKYYLLLVSSDVILFGVFGELNYRYFPPQSPQLLQTMFIVGLWLFFVSWGLKEVGKILNNYIVRGKI